MLKNFFKVAFRGLSKNKMHSFLNITGLSAGMAVTFLIGLWVNDEFSADKYHKNYKSIAQVFQNQTFSGVTSTQPTVPMPLGHELRSAYGRDFKVIVMSSNPGKHILASQNNQFIKSGNYMEREAPTLFSLKILAGSANGLKDIHSILLSSTTADAIFGTHNPINQIVKFDDTASLRVTGVYEDLPSNATLHDLQFIVPWELQGKALTENIQNWNNNNAQTYVQIADGADMNKVSSEIRNSKYARSDKAEKMYQPMIFLQPMSRWHLYSEFKNGVNVGGRIQYIWLFGCIGISVLLLACINFMNLATAKTEKRAREVGVRKAIGSERKQLVYQFLSESILMTFLAFILSLGLLEILLFFFNDLADERLSVPFLNPVFWAAGIGFTLISGLIAGSYPAFYLSSFQPVKVLKGTFRAGRLAALPRKVLVVFQFTVSIAIIIGTVIVFQQTKFAKDRPVGYSRNGLINVTSLTPDIYTHFDAFKNELMKTGAVSGVAWSSTPMTESWNSQSNFDWTGRDKSGTQNFGTIGISKEYGHTIGWQFVQGRDYRTGKEGADALNLVLNESAVRLMGFKNPVGESVNWYGLTFHIIGVVKDMVMNSPFTPAQPTVFYIAPWQLRILTIKLNAGASPGDALKTIKRVYTQYNPGQPFEYNFVDEEYSKKFALEDRVGKLASFFAILAILISCLGIFGMATFIAEQRVKEIGVRKVLGASVFSLWQLLSKDFVFLILISILIASPLAFYFMHTWLQNYDYRTTISWWIFFFAGAGALLITLLTVSFQSIKAALENPVKSLRTE